MDIELVETLHLILERYGNRTHGSVFIPMRDFPWYSERNDQLSVLFEEGFITKPRFYDNGAEITLTSNGRHFFDMQERGASLTKEKIYEILTTLNKEMKIPDNNFGYGRTESLKIIENLQNEGLIAGASFAKGGLGNLPKIVWLEQAYITVDGLNFIDDYEKSIHDLKAAIDLPHEFISACAKIADNPASYAAFNEDGLNREMRNYLDSAISRFGFAISDQTQQGLGRSGKNAGELDIRICKGGIPVAIYEGLIHSTKAYLYEHIEKAVGKYNQSGCKAVYVVEFSRIKGFGGFWDSATEYIEEHPMISNVEEVNTGLLGVKMLKGNYDWNGQQGDFFYVGVNCFAK